MAEIKDITCVFPLEVKARDLDARLRLALECAKHGFEAVIGHKPSTASVVETFGRNFVFFDKGLEPVKAGYYRHLVEIGGMIVSLDEEGGVYNARSDIRILEGKYHPSVVEHVELVLMWGQSQTDRVLPLYEKSEQHKFVVSGNPRFDLRKPEYNTFYNKIIHPANRIQKPYILFNTNFGWANNQLNREELLKVESATLTSYYPDNFFEESMEHEIRHLDLFVDAVKDVAKRLPETTLVLRPHPAENIDFYHKAFEGVANIVIVREGSAHELIVNAAMVVIKDCTTGIEAFLNDKTTVSFLPELRMDLVQTVPVEISIRACTADDIIGVYRSLGNAAPSPEQKALNAARIKPIIANTDFESTALIANEVVRKAQEYGFMPPRPGRLQPRLPWYKKLVSRIVSGLRRQASGDRVSDRLKNKFPGLSANELEQRIRLFREVDPNIPQMAVEHIGDNLFRLYRNEN